ncbi:MAG: 4-hydroxy-3-methylbut-2-enyl diphosphate reductase [Halothiobacillaceae bacterium]|nr:MAG: 4-hydroxy-3-methylbut-2-enyl diphosphate reductase [Halothiobacillaceae bacterium]
MDLLLANPRGFCAGVDRAIGIVERALEVFGAPVYVRHEVVHNKFVVDGLRDKGAIFVDDLALIPDDAIVIFSAHGVPKAVWQEAEARGLRIFDATCPLVTKVHIEVAKHAELHRDVVLIGHAGHPEVEGTTGQYEKLGGQGDIYLVERLADVAALPLTGENGLAYVTQTTLSVDETIEIIQALKNRFPHIIGPRKDDICYATQNRQDAVKKMSEVCDLVLVVGSENSSNSNRPAFLIDSAAQIQPQWLEGRRQIGVTAGASAPEILVQEVIARLRAYGANVTEQRGREESIVFSLPKALQ